MCTMFHIYIGFPPPPPPPQFYCFPSSSSSSSSILYISENLIMARFAVFQRIKLHQIFTAASISPSRLTHAFVSFPFKSLARFLLI